MLTLIPVIPMGIIKGILGEIFLCSFQALVRSDFYPKIDLCEPVGIIKNKYTILNINF